MHPPRRAPTRTVPGAAAHGTHPTPRPTRRSGSPGRGGPAPGVEVEETVDPPLDPLTLDGTPSVPPLPGRCGGRGEAVRGPPRGRARNRTPALGLFSPLSPPHFLSTPDPRPGPPPQPPSLRRRPSKTFPQTSPHPLPIPSHPLVTPPYALTFPLGLPRATGLLPLYLLPRPAVASGAGNGGPGGEPAAQVPKGDRSRAEGGGPRGHGWTSRESGLGPSSSPASLASGRGVGGRRGRGDARMRRQRRRWRNFSCFALSFTYVRVFFSIFR